MNSPLFHLLMLTVVLAPLPLGANREWAWSALALVLAVLALAWAVQAAMRPARVSLALHPAPVVLFLAVCAWAGLQTWPGLPQGWAHPLWELNAEALAAIGAAPDAPTTHTVSLAPDDGHAALLRLLSYALVFFLAFQAGRERRRAQQALRWLALAALAYAVYGLTVFWGRQDTLLWLFELDYIKAVRGSFVNRNHFATWLGLGLLCAIALFHQQLSLRRNPAYQTPTRRELRFEQFMLQSWRSLATLIVVGAALILTHSRGGFFSTLLGVLTLLLALNFRQRFRKGRYRALLVAVLLTSVAVFMLTSEVLLKRMDHLGADSAVRLDAYQLTASGIEDNPLLGFGYGAFAEAFRLYRDERIHGFLDKTHNTYLENLFELGWPAALALFASIAWLALICVRGLRERRRDWVYPATGLAATVLVGVHAAFDFSLQIPAVAIAYACLMGVACAQSRPASRR